jgi:hypothetical protein
MRITSKGQETITREMPERAGLAAGTDAVFAFQDGGLRRVKAGRMQRARRGGRNWWRVCATRVLSG